MKEHEVLNNQGAKLLCPPGRMFFQAGHHWIEEFDFDGRSMGVKVLQWQPGSKRWCHSNMYATGNDKEIQALYSRWICEAPMPDIENDLEVLKNIRVRANRLRIALKNGEALDETNQQTIVELCKMFGDPM